jgi:hypothetical protein
MNKADLKDLIDNEFKRVKIENHENYTRWYATLKPYSRQIVDFILEQDLTPEYIIFARDAPVDEQQQFPFLSIIAAGSHDPSSMPSLTNFTLGDILLEIQNLGD